MVIEQIKHKIFSKLDLGIQNTKNINKKDLFEIKESLKELFNNYDLYLKIK